MASEEKLALDELRCLYELAKKEELFAKRASIVHSFAVSVFTEPCWYECIKDAEREYDDEFVDYPKKVTAAFNKVRKVRKCVLAYLEENALGYLLEKAEANRLITDSAEDIVLIVTQFQALIRILDLLESEHSKFVEQFKEFKFKRENPAKNKYNFAFRYDDLNEEIHHLQRISPTLVYSQFRILGNFAHVYDPSGYAEVIDVLKKRKREIMLLSFCAATCNLNANLNSCVGGLSSELDAMRRVICFFAKRVGVSSEDDGNQVLWSYDSGRFVGNGQLVLFRKSCRPAKILEILTKSVASRKKIWTYEELAEVIDGDSLKDGKVVSYYKQCERITDDIYDGTEIVDFLIYDTTRCYINPEYVN